VASIAFFLLLAASVTACSSGPDEQDRAAATLQAALQAHQEGRLERAVDLYKEVIALEPTNKFAWYNLGLIHQKQGDNPAAEESYREAIAIDPEFVAALFNLAVLQTAMGAQQEAIALYRRVLEVQPQYAPAHLNLGFALIDAGERREGKDELALAVQIDPSLASRIPEGLAVDVMPSPGAGSPTASASPSSA
jgi:tetratricopeptide (TPR) repeat protein